ncbi:MAG TPA: Rrf2 family transcriptional regulator [Terriglobales bacterium]|nr:Rrf2 family transcriptional regulator [Terriglobales bacterium]
MLSMTSQYALRALAELAKLPDQGSMLGKDLAQKADIPANYLAKILLSLKNAGVLGTARGSHGGYWLERSPETIKLEEIVKLFDGPVATNPCVLGERKDCNENDPCTAHVRWSLIRKAYEAFLHETTIADLAGNPEVQVIPN